MAKVKLTKTTTSDPLGTVNKLKTYVGFSTVNRDFDSNTLYDYELARTDLLNALINTHIFSPDIYFSSQ